MLLGIALGQRTPGHSTAEVVAFERRINQRYVDYMGGAGWDYLGVYDVDALVPGGFGELYLVDAPDVGEAVRRDLENDRAGVPADVADFYVECRALLWQRPSIRLWTEISSESIPQPGETIRVTLLPALAPQAHLAWPWTGEGQTPVAAVRVERLGDLGIVAPRSQRLGPGVDSLPSEISLPVALLFKPLAPAPTIHA